MRAAATLLAGLLASACASAGERPDWAAIQAQLTQRVAIDQELRRELMEGGMEHADQNLFGRLAAVDENNTNWMKELIAQHGWPTIAEVGKEGAGNAWLLVQHADHDVDFQEQCLALLTQAVAAGQGDPKDLAYLQDRVALRRGRPQRYGTQFVQAPDGLGFVPHVLEDEAHVDELRAAVGLMPLEEYAALVNGNAAAE